MSYFPEPHTHSKKQIEIELDLSNYATKSYLKNATGGNISDFEKINAIQTTDTSDLVKKR